jgi:hypothetical protein
VRTGADVAPEVDPPHPAAAQPVGVDVDVAGVARLGVVLGVGGVPLEDHLVAAVTVEVAHAHVVGGVGVGDAVRCGPARRGLDRHVEVGAAGEAQGGLGGGLLDAADHRAHGVGGVRRGARVEVVGGGGDG